MSETLYGASLVKSPRNEVNLRSDVIGVNSTVFTSGDPVTISGGLLQVAGTTNSVAGVVEKTQTMTSTNNGVANVKPSFIPADEDYEFLMGTNSDLAATSVGTFYKLTTATTAVVQVDVSTGAVTGLNRVVVCTKVDPKALGGSGSGSGLREGLFKFVKVVGIRNDTD